MKSSSCQRDMAAHMRIVALRRVRMSTRRFETPPAKQAQCDWSELGTIVDNGVELSLPVFVMIMGYSRKTFAAFSADTWRFNL